MGSLNESQGIQFVKAMKTMRNQNIRNIIQTCKTLENELIDAYEESKKGDEDQTEYEKALGKYIAFQVQNYEGASEEDQFELDYSLMQIKQIVPWKWDSRREMEESVQKVYTELYDTVEPDEIEEPENEAPEEPKQEEPVEEERGITGLPINVERAFIDGINQIRQDPPKDALREMGEIYDEVFRNFNNSKNRDAAFGKLLGYQYEIMNTKGKYEDEKKTIETGTFNYDIFRAYKDYHWKNTKEMMTQLAGYAEQLKGKLVESKAPNPEKQWDAFKKSGLGSFYKFAKDLNKRVDDSSEVGDKEKGEMFGAYSILRNKFESRSFFGKIFHLHEKFLCNKMENTVLDAWDRKTVEEMKTQAVADGQKYDFGKDGDSLAEKKQLSEQIIAQKQEPAAEKQDIKVDFGDTFAPEKAQKVSEKSGPEQEKEITIEAKGPASKN